MNSTAHRTRTISRLALAIAATSVLATACPEGGMNGDMDGEGNGGGYGLSTAGTSEVNQQAGTSRSSNAP